MEEEVLKLPRAYIANVIYTLVGPPFKEWVDLVIAQRNQKILEEQNQLIELDPEVYKAFKESNHISGKLQAAFRLINVL